MLAIGLALIASTATTTEDRASVLFQPGRGVTLASADGEFALNTTLRGQLQYALEAEPEASVEEAFQLRRARITFSGHVFGAKNKYKIQLGVAPRDMGFGGDADTPPTLSERAHSPSRSPVLDWQFDFVHLRDLSLRVGQFKVPFSRERLISSGDLNLVDRSTVNAEFNLDRDLGFALYSKKLFGLEPLRYWLGISIGEGLDAYTFSDPGLLYVARFELVPLGGFDDYSEGDLERSSDLRVAFGAAYAFVDEAKGNRGILGRRPADGGTTDSHHVTADAHLKWMGLSLLLEFHWRDGEREQGSATDTSGAPIATVPARKGIGSLVQAGYMLPFDLEVVGRYALIRGSDDTSLSTLNETALGLSYYLAGHALKVQADYARQWADEFEKATNTGRLQLQLAL